MLGPGETKAQEIRMMKKERGKGSRRASEDLNTCSKALLIGTKLTQHWPECNIAIGWLASKSQRYPFWSRSSRAELVIWSRRLAGTNFSGQSSFSLFHVRI